MPLPQVRCREIRASDRNQIVDLYTHAFRTPRTEWVNAFHRLSEHATPVGYPRYGYVLESEGRLVGALLLIYASVSHNGVERIRCSVSTWYVEPAFRFYAAALVARALEHKNVTYTNGTPAPHTWPVLEAQGYIRYCNGKFAAIPVLSASETCCVEIVSSDTQPDNSLSQFDVRLLLDHAKYGCISVVCRASGRRYPFVFLPRRKRGMLRYAYLAYCHSRDDFVRFARPLGWFLMRTGFLWVVVDASAPIPGLIGRYVDNRPKYFRGPDPPPLGDLAYTEMAMFGV
jgi:hypothetical protein